MVGGVEVFGVDVGCGAGGGDCGGVGGWAGNWVEGKEGVGFGP